MTANQLHILRHSLGLDYNGRGKQYRNYYATDKSDSKCEELVALGFMRRGREMNEGTLQYYIVTDAGKVEAVKDVVPLKQTLAQRRYQHFLTLDFGISFHEYLKCKLYERV